MPPIKRRPYTKNIQFDRYDTQKLEEVRATLQKVYDYNYDSSRKVKLLETIISKLDKLIADYGEPVGTEESRGY